MVKFEKIFEPGMIGRVQLRNRLIKSVDSAAGATIDGYMTDTLIGHYAEGAKGGVGMVSVGIASVFREAPLSTYYPALYDETYVPGHKKQTDAIHKWGAKANLQIGHHGGAAAWRLTHFKQKIDVVGPSAMVFPGSTVCTREMTREDIRHVADGFARAAVLAKEAGYDCVELHASGRSLINQFRSPFFNKRTDEYGGSVENRARFACEIVAAIKRAVGAEMAVILKIGVSDQLGGGLTAEDSLVHAPMFADAGLDALLATAGIGGLSPNGGLGMHRLNPMAPQVHYAAALKRVVKIPVIAGARLDIPRADKVLREGSADFVTLCRPLIADPYYPIKARKGRFADVRRCIYCDDCSWSSKSVDFRLALKGRGMVCAVNPNLGNEGDPEWEVLKPAAPPKTVIVVGAGVGGMEAARTLAERGHHVTIYEKSDRLGGRWNTAALLKGRRLYLSLITSLSKGLKNAGVQVVMEREVTPGLVRSIRPDAVVVATGAVPAPIDVPGVTTSNVVVAEDILTGNARLGKTVIVVGVPNPAAELAYTIMDRCDKLALVLVPETRRLLAGIYEGVKAKLLDHGVHIYNNASVVQVLEGELIFQCNNEVFCLKADTVVMASVGKSENWLATELQGIVPEVYTIGDAVEPRSVEAALREGAEIGRRI